MLSLLIQMLWFIHASCPTFVCVKITTKTIAYNVTTTSKDLCSKLKGHDTRQALQLQCMSHDMMWLTWNDIIWHDWAWAQISSGVAVYMHASYMAWHGIIWHDMKLYDMIWHNMTWHNTSYDMAWHSMPWNVMKWQ